MRCPRCETPVLDERDRDGVTLDQCPECRGVWLDRGELEKLVNRAVQEIEAAGRLPDGDRDRTPRDRPYAAPSPHDPGRTRRDDDDDDDDDRWRRGTDARRDGQSPRRRGGWFSTLGDLFGD
ncbi:MAG: zf-TFIIB domain-containing protein [Planctomycetota bacterium]